VDAGTFAALGTTPSFVWAAAAIWLEMTAGLAADCAGATSATLPMA
jgi:hypothetical protein